MSTKSYRNRIAASKAAIELDCEAVAAANPTLDARELRDLIKEERNIPVTEEYAEELVGRFGSSAPRPR